MTAVTFSGSRFLIVPSQFAFLVLAFSQQMLNIAGDGFQGFQLWFSPESQSAQSEEGGDNYLLADDFLLFYIDLAHISYPTHVS